MGADRHAIIKVDDVLIEQADTARGHRLTDALRLGGAMQTKESVVAVAIQIKRAGTEWIFRAAIHAAGIMPIERDRRLHVLGRGPMRPLLLAADHRGAAEIGALGAADTDAIAQRAAAGL